MHKDFAKIFNTKVFGQILVVRLIDDEHPQLRFYYSRPDGEQQSFSLVSQNTEAGHKMANNLFENINEAMAMLFVRNYLCIPPEELLQ